MLNVDNRTIFQADNIDVLRGLNSQSVDLVYLDPPFNKNDTFVSGDSKRVREIKEFFIDKQAQGEFKGVDFDEVFKDDRAAFKDIWSRNDLNEEYYQQINDHDSRLITYIDSVKDSTPPGGFYYLIYMTVRLIEIKRVLKDSGSLYLHCDPTFSHYLKGLLDLLLGVDNFRNEIVWCYTQLGGSLKAFPKKHDYLLFYSKSPSYTFNRQFIPYKKSNKSSGVYKFKNLTPEQQAKVETIDKRGKSVESWWIDLPIVNSQAKERMGYPTQKPLKLLERIILASSREGDIVLDPFCGCATTCLAAEKLDRQWLGIDKNPQTYYMIYYRAYQSGLLGTKDKPSLLSNTLIQTTKIPSRTDLSAVDKRYQKQLAINLKQAKKLQAAKDSRSKLTTRDRQLAINSLYGQQAGFCQGCDVYMPKENLTLDHIIPQSANGPDNLSNLQLLCYRDNVFKGNRPMTELLDKLLSEQLISPSTHTKLTKQWLQYRKDNPAYDDFCREYETKQKGLL